MALLASLYPAAASSAETALNLPQFRTVQSVKGKIPLVGNPAPVRILADSDFPPFSFASARGEASGIAVDLAKAACAEIKIECQVSLLPFAKLAAALASGEGDVIISGPVLDEALAGMAEPTRPYFRTMGRFAVQSGSPLVNGDAAQLDGKRIGVLKDTAHAKWLETYYPGSEIVPFDTDALAGEALRTGNIDALFGDNLRVIYWVAGTESKACCRLAGNAYSDLDAFTRNMSFFVGQARPDLRAAFDYGLDMAQASGAMNKAFNSYLPLNPW